MPGRARDGSDLALGLLDAILAERREPGLDRGDEPIGRDGLRDGDERDRAGVAPDPGAGVGDLVEDPGAGRPEGRYFRRRNEGISRSSAS
jgi:hypothetical protein